MNTNKTSIDKTSNNLKPMSILEAAIYFFFFSAFIFIGLHIALPYLINNGTPLYIPYYISLTAPCIVGIVLSIVLYKKERHKQRHNMSFFERFMIKKLSWCDLAWTIGLILFWFITFVTINGLTKNIISKPEYLLYTKGTWFNLPIQANYPIAIWLVIFLITNILGEELFWRGYMIPRLEKRYGNWAWLINGILWSLFHIPVFYIMPAIAPGCVALAFVVQKRHNISIGIIAHLALNGAEIISLIVAVIS